LFPASRGNGGGTVTKGRSQKKRRNLENTKKEGRGRRFTEGGKSIVSRTTGTLYNTNFSGGGAGLQSTTSQRIGRKGRELKAGEKKSCPLPENCPLSLLLLRRIKGMPVGGGGWVFRLIQASGKATKVKSSWVRCEDPEGVGC